MSYYYDRLRDLEISRKVALQHEISRTAYQSLLESEQISHLQRKLDIERQIEFQRKLEVERALALEAEAARQRELELRLAQERELQARAELAQRSRLQENRIRRIEAEMDILRRRIDEQRIEQQRLSTTAGNLGIEIAELYRLSDERENSDMKQLEALDKEMFEVEKKMRQSDYKRKALENSIEQLTKQIS